MEFDKSRVYTVLNADKLEVGSMVIVADTLKTLKEKVTHFDYEGMVRRLIKINDESKAYRFAINEDEVYALAYFVSPSESKKTPKYKPFSNSETAYKTIAAHGRWLKMKYFFTGIGIRHSPFVKNAPLPMTAPPSVKKSRAATPKRAAQPKCALTLISATRILSGFKPRALK